MNVKMILPTLTEAGSPFWRPIKYSLFPPLGLATLAGYFSDSDDISIVDEHVEVLYTDDSPDLVIIQVYITNAYRAYSIADDYRSRGIFVALGGLHVTSMPNEASQHADSIFLGPGEDTLPKFLQDFKNKRPQKRYDSIMRTLIGIPPPRRDLIKRHLYLVPNSIVVSRGCPHHCDFCYKDSFFNGGKSFYTQKVDRILAEIEQLPGRHLYFLDDHLFGNTKFVRALFDGMKGMNRLFQSAGTVHSVLHGDLMERAYDAGLRSLFVGFETLSDINLQSNNKFSNKHEEYDFAIQRLHELGIMINASFVYGFDSDDSSVFKRTVDWAVKQAVTTSTFHILTPYPGTVLYSRMLAQKQIFSSNWDHYDTRHAVYIPKRMTVSELEKGYWWAYKEFYSMKNILAAGTNHSSMSHMIKHLAYTIGWKKMEPLWKVIIQARQLGHMRPLLETILTGINKKESYNKMKQLRIEKSRQIQSA